jgi:light-independent protochlorophyllide reductase subunit B
VHVQDFPARYSPQMGFEGANVLFDTFVHPLMMGLEEHLLQMFREDFEFHADAAPSHLGGAAPVAAPPSAPIAPAPAAPAPVVHAPVAPAHPHSAAAAFAAGSIGAGIAMVADAVNTVADLPLAVVPEPAGDKPPPWTPDAEKELRKIPFFVRGKARRNTERFAQDRGLSQITVETLYDAKAHFSR